jgi:hypothetical protein
LRPAAAARELRMPSSSSSTSPPSSSCVWLRAAAVQRRRQEGGLARGIKSWSRLSRDGERADRAACAWDQKLIALIAGGRGSRPGRLEFWILNLAKFVTNLIYLGLFAICKLRKGRAGL